MRSSWWIAIAVVTFGPACGGQQVEPVPEAVPVPPEEQGAAAANGEPSAAAAENDHGHTHEHAPDSEPPDSADPLVEDGVRGRRFTRAEDWAERFDKPGRQVWQKPDEVVSLMAIEPGMTVADIGAGTGYFISRLSAAVGPSGRVYGLDIEADMIRYMKERAKREGLTNFDARVVQPDDPGLAPASVDRVLIVNTWHHIAGREDYAKRIAAGLKPGGALIVVDYTLDTPHGPPKDHRLDPKVVVAELEAGGLEAERIDETLPRQFIVVGRRK